MVACLEEEETAEKEREEMINKVEDY